MNRLVVFIMLSVFAVSAHAQTQPIKVTEQDQSKSMVATEVVAAKDAKERLSDRSCLRETGSRVLRKNKHGCINASGRSYSRADLERTGSFTLAEAITRMDVRAGVRRR